jgi:hypothetical protein
MVGAAVAHPAATPAPRVRAAPYVVLQGAYLRDWHLEPSTVCGSLPNPCPAQPHRLPR